MASFEQVLFTNKRLQKEKCFVVDTRANKLAGKFFQGKYICLIYNVFVSTGCFCWNVCQLSTLGESM
jgi:hypothetical protein